MKRNLVRFQKGRTREVGGAFYFSLLETAALYPLAVLLSAYALYVSPLLLLLAAWAVHTAGVVTGSAQSRGSRIKPLSPLWPVVLFLAAVLLPLGIFGLQLYAGIAGLLGLGVAARGLVAGRKHWHKAAPMRLPLIGLAAALIVYITAGRVQAIEPFRASLYVMAMLSLFMLLLRWNGERVQYASRAETADRQLFRKILSANRSMTAIVLLVIVVLSSWTGLGEIFRLLRDGIRSLLAFFFGGEQPGEPAPQQNEPQQMPDFAGMDGGPAHQPLWLQIAGYVFLALVGLAAAVLLGYGIYRLIRRWLPERIRRLLRGLAYRMGLLRSIRRLPDEAADFVDEIEKIDRIAARPRRFRRLTKQQEEAGGENPRQAYESLIRRAVRKGFAFHPSRTPAENGDALVSGKAWTNLPEEKVAEVIERYNSARYGSLPSKANGQDR